MFGQSKDHLPTTSTPAVLIAAPKKVVFSGLKPLKGCCFSCSVVSPSNLRCVNGKNVAFKAILTRLVKQALLIDLPDDVDVRVCVTCTKRMEKVCLQDYCTAITHHIIQILTCNLRYLLSKLLKSCE